MMSTFWVVVMSGLVGVFVGVVVCIAMLAWALTRRPGHREEIVSDYEEEKD